MLVFAKRLSLALLALGLCAPHASADGWQHLGTVQRVEKLKDGVELTAGRAKVRITAFNDGIVRVRVAPQGSFPKDFSWAVIEAPQPPAVKIDDSKTEVRIAAASTTVVVQKSPLLISFADAGGNILLADEPTLPMAFDAQRIRVWKKMPPDENYYGLGDKTGPMNRRNRAFTMWNSDVFGWGESTDPMYKAITFFLGLRKGTAYGVFFDNTYRTSFDFGKESPDYFSFGSEGGELNYYFLAGPDPKKVVQEYTALVGRSPLPPLWTLGYQQSRYSYYPDTSRTSNKWFPASARKAFASSPSPISTSKKTPATITRLTIPESKTMSSSKIPTAPPLSASSGPAQASSRISRSPARVIGGAHSTRISSAWASPVSGTT